MQPLSACAKRLIADELRGRNSCRVKATYTKAPAMHTARRFLAPVPIHLHCSCRGVYNHHALSFLSLINTFRYEYCCRLMNNIVYRIYSGVFRNLKGGGYITGVHFQKCSNFSIQFFTPRARYVPNVGVYMYENSVRRSIEDRPTDQRPRIWEISNGHISARGRPIHFMFGSTVGFSGPVDRMALFPV